jgi:small subunit ribosomal protein S6
MQYEIAVLYDPDLEVDLEKATSRVEKILADNGAKVTNVDNWGKRKLAYTIKKHDMAIYVFYTVEMPGANVQKLESILNITDEVIRMFVQPGPESQLQRRGWQLAGSHGLHRCSCMGPARRACCAISFKRSPMSRERPAAEPQLGE